MCCSLTGGIGNQAPINYLARVNAGKLKLIQGDTETFTDVLTLINEYEGICDTTLSTLGLPGC
jgi:hypothetical protein